MLQVDSFEYVEIQKLQTRCGPDVMMSNFKRNNAFVVAKYVAIIWAVTKTVSMFMVRHSPSKTFVISNFIVVFIDLLLFEIVRFVLRRLIRFDGS